MLHAIYHWIAWTWGDKTPGQGVGYAIFSGPLPDVTIFSAGFAVWRKHTCQVQRCFRLTWKHTAAGDHVCRKHHPDSEKTHAEVLAAHNDALAGVPGPETSNLGG